MSGIIEFKKFSFQYDAQTKPTLHDINLTINKGEKVVIVGPSGSGKSTLVNCLNGLIPYVYTGTYSGSLNIDGLSIGKGSLFDCSKKIGTVLQDPDGQFVGLTVAEDIAFALENDKVLQEEMKDRVSRMAGIVDMTSMLGVNPYNCSGGQKQRVSIAGVMVDDVPILLFDEPLANLDPKTGKTTIELIDDLHKMGKTIIIIEHRLEDVLHRDVDRIIVIGDGRILMDDTPNNVLSSDILIRSGIREPLYLTCCKYAGIDITPQMDPKSIDEFKLGDNIEKLKKWYENNAEEEETVNMKPLLSISNLSFDYDGTKTVLDDVSLDVYEGEMMAIVGKNGAGKSTLSKLIVGFEKPDSGDIRIYDESILDKTIKERALEIGIVLQNPNQMISQNLIFDEIALGLRVRGVDEEEIKSRVYDVMKICGLYPFRNWPISALSFGQKRRVCIAAILVLNPKIIILDEPTAGQDYAHYSEIMEFLRELNKKGQTIMLITHDMHLMLEYTKRAAVFCDSKKLADTRSYEVLCDPELVEKANLKETSLFTLANNCGFEDPLGFVKCFINYDRKVRSIEE